MEDMTKSAERKINDTADKMREGVDKARKQGVDYVERTFPNAEEAIERAKAKGDAMWDRAKSKGHDLLDDVEASSQEAWKQTKSFIQKRPAQAIGYAALIGLVLGFFLAPKGND